MDDEVDDLLDIPAFLKRDPTEKLTVQPIEDEPKEKGEESWKILLRQHQEKKQALVDRRNELAQQRKERAQRKRDKAETYERFLRWVDRQGVAFSFIGIKKNLTMDEKAIRSCLRKALKKGHVVKHNRRLYKKGD